MSEDLGGPNPANKEMEIEMIEAELDQLKMTKKVSVEPIQVEMQNVKKFI